jgi:hypothetical protein
VGSGLVKGWLGLQLSQASILIGMDEMAGFIEADQPESVIA